MGKQKGLGETTPPAGEPLGDQSSKDRVAQTLGVPSLCPFGHDTQAYPAVEARADFLSEWAIPSQGAAPGPVAAWTAGQ